VKASWVVSWNGFGGDDKVGAAQKGDQKARMGIGKKRSAGQTASRLLTMSGGD